MITATANAYRTVAAGVVAKLLLPAVEALLTRWGVNPKTSHAVALVVDRVAGAIIETSMGAKDPVP